MTGERTGYLCPYHSTLANGMQLYPATHPCLAVYYEAADR